MAKIKARADQLVGDQGLVDGRERAKRLIMAGQVLFVDPSGHETPVDKPGRMFGAETVFVLKQGERYVSRGGGKLETAMEAFGLDVTGLVALDAGASTGGFTDCLLQHGAARVYAVDVGKCQLHERLRADPRVVSLEGVDARNLAADLIPDAPDLIVTDVSFIGLAKALPAALALAAGGADLVALVKPQFEVGPEHVGKGGLVKDEAARRRALDEVAAFLSASRWAVREVADSPIAGGDGNLEYLLWAQRA